MSKKIVKKSIELSGRTLSFETGRLANRATSSVLAQYGETVVLATVVIGKEDLKKDYFPLSVEYQERLYAGGRIKGSRWVKREARGTDAEILSGRLTDRSIRPLFPKWFRNEVQVILTIMAVDSKNDADVLALNAASAAICISPVPFAGPIAGVRVGLSDNQPVINPENGDQSGTELDLVVASTEKLVTMLEAGANQVAEDIMYSALEAGFNANQQVIGLIKDMTAECGQDKIVLTKKDKTPQLVTDVQQKAKDLIKEAVNANKETLFIEREHAFELAREGVVASFESKDQQEVREILEDLFSSEFRKQILEKQVRVDGRKLDELRPLTAEVGVLPRVHGSAIFQRGETQALSVTTLGAPSLYQSLESAEGEDHKRYMHHYNFPPYSTGETGRVGMPGRREIGHGALAERALTPVIPSEVDFPYAIRVVSEILSSNGSTSMASTCGSTLSLMDAGVPLLAPVTGISTGLITPEGYPTKTDGYVLLTDINGAEDHHGDMDFKVAGTERGITAIQLDVKVPGLTLEICKETFARARTARMQIMEVVLKAISAPRASISKYAPQIQTTTIPVDKIGELIGPGGKNIKKLMADTETQIDTRDDGSVFITGISSEGVAKAIAYISGLGKEVQQGEVYDGTVASIMPYGAFVNILPGKDGLVHVSRMAQDYVSDPNTLVQVGQTVKVWVTEIDSQGRVNLSMLFDTEGHPLEKAAEDRPQQSRPPMQRDHFSAPQPRRDRDRGPRRRF